MIDIIGVAILTLAIYTLPFVLIYIVAKRAVRAALRAEREIGAKR